MQEYFHLAYSFCGTFKHLYLYYLSIKYDMGGGLRPTIYYLTHFSRLTHLTIYNCHRSGERYVDMAMVLHTCPHLISFIFKSDFRLPVKDTTDKRTASWLLYNQQYRPMVLAPKLKIKDITLYLPNLPKRYIQCISSHLSTFPESFKLHINDTESGVWIQETNVDIMERFGKYLGLVEGVLDVWIHRHRAKEYALSTVAPPSHEVMSKYWPFIGLIMENRKMTCHTRILISNLGYWRFDTNVHVKRHRQYLFLSYNLDATDYKSCLISNPMYALIPPSCNSSVNSFFAKMTIMIEVVSEDEDASNSGCSEILESLINSCTKLTYLVFLNTDDDGYRMKFGSTPTLFDCNRKYHEDAICEYCEPLQDDESSTIQRLQYVLLKDAYINEQLIDTVSRLLFNLKVLKIIGCRLDRDHKYNAVIGIRGIEHLHELVLDIGHSNDRHYTYIKLETSQHREIYHVSNNNDSLKPKSMYSNDFDKFSSNLYNVISVKCQEVDLIRICLHSENITSTIIPGQSTYKAAL